MQRSWLGHQLLFVEKIECWSGIFNHSSSYKPLIQKCLLSPTFWEDVLFSDNPVFKNVRTTYFMFGWRFGVCHKSWGKACAPLPRIFSLNESVHDNTVWRTISIQTVLPSIKGKDKFFVLNFKLFSKIQDQIIFKKYTV